MQKKVGKNIKYDINLAILKTVKSHNSNIDSIIKYSLGIYFLIKQKKKVKNLEIK